MPNPECQNYSLEYIRDSVQHRYQIYEKLIFDHWLSMKSSYSYSKNFYYYKN